MLTGRTCPSFGSKTVPKTGPRICISIELTPWIARLNTTNAAKLCPDNWQPWLQVGNASGMFKLGKPQVKKLKKTASVKQLYKSVLQALKTISREE